MISYLLQAISTALFGPIFAAVIMYFELKNGRSSGLNSMIFEAALEIADMVLKTNIILSFSVGVAGVFRTTQSPPLGERTFMGYLSIFQCVITLGFYFSSIAYGNSFIFKYYLYQLSVMVSNILVLVLLSALLSSRTDILKGVMSQCAIEHNFPLAVKRTSSRTVAIYWGSCLAVGLLAVGFLVAVLPESMKNLIQAARSRSRRSLSTNSTRYLHISPRFNFLGVGFLLCAAFWTGIIIYLMVAVERDRQKLQTASGSPNQDSQWGFGQVMAVVSWAPVLHDIFVKAKGSFY